MEKNRNKNRRRLDIVREVLSITSVKIRKTRVMYQANLGYAQLEKYLKVLLDCGLVERDGDSMYLTTQKGREFLDAYADYLARCSLVRKEVEGTTRERQLLEDAFFHGRNNGAQTSGKKEVEA